MSNVQYNLMLASAAAFSDQALFDQLLLESTVLGMPLDAQTYIKTLGAMRDADDRRDYLDTLMRTDLAPADCHFASRFALQLTFDDSAQIINRAQKEQYPEARVPNKKGSPVGTESEGPRTSTDCAATAAKKTGGTPEPFVTKLSETRNRFASQIPSTESLA